MHEFDFANRTNALLTPEIVGLLTRIHEFRGKQALMLDAKPEVLSNLHEFAILQSTDASCKIAGICTDDERLELLVREKTRPVNRDEQAIAGYRDALAQIHENYAYIPPNPGSLIQLHRDLYKYTGLEGGHYRVNDDANIDIISSGDGKNRFRPVSAGETAGCMDALCDAWAKAVADETLDPLLLMPSFILDFLCVQPFAEGNWRMSCLLTLLLLNRAGYVVGGYVSVERLIERTRQRYFDALAASVAGWHENANDYAPFTQYLLEIILTAYQELAERVEALSVESVSKPGRVRAVIKDAVSQITKAEIMRRCPDISQITVQRALNELQRTGEIVKLGGGRYTAYKWNQEEKQP